MIRIQKVIKNRAVIGEYQPYRYEGGAYGKRVPDGKPIKDYFPRVVSDAEFDHAQPPPMGYRRGRPNKWVRLLTGLLVDSHDRAMHIHMNAGSTFPTYQTAGQMPETRRKPAALVGRTSRTLCHRGLRRD